MAAELPSALKPPAQEGSCGSSLITGGLGSLGLLAAQWLLADSSGPCKYAHIMPGDLHVFGAAAGHVRCAISLP